MNKIYKTVLSVAATAIVAGATMVPVAVNAWGDSSGGRKVYKIEEINSGALGNKITFNSITNSAIGDERNFVGARVSTNTNGNFEANEINVKGGETYTIRLYVHNNSPYGLNAVAENVAVRFSLPVGIDKSHTVIGYLSSSNAEPNVYYDEVKFVSNEDFYLEYVEGSAKYTNKKLGTVGLQNEVVSKNGVSIGYEDVADGKIPGCFDYTGQVTIDVKVHNATNAKISKTVRLNGTKDDFGESVNAKVGDEVEFQIEYVNLSNENVDNVMIRDVLPNNMEYVENSTRLYNAGYPEWVQVVQNTVTTTGINIGNYAANGNAYVRFTAKVVNKSLACGSNQLVNWASSTVNSRVAKDSASVMVNRDDAYCKENPKPTPTPTPDNPEPTPEEIVNTGASEVAFGALGVGSTVTALGYYIASRKKLM